MADLSADALVTLSETEEGGAIIGLLSDATEDGDIVWTTLGALAAAQQRERPKTIGVQRQLLVQYSGVDTANRVNVSSNNSNLTLNSLAPGQSFDDDYFAIEIHYRHILVNGDPGNGWITVIPIEVLNAPESASDFLPTFDQIRRGNSQIYRVSDTHFALLNMSQNSRSFLKAIYGLKLVI